MRQKTYITRNVIETKQLGRKLGERLKGGEVFELISDLGGGKTTWVSGLAEGFGSSDSVASPSFTISYVYGRPDKKALHHFDFYRLNEPGVAASELSEVVGDSDVVTVVEWGSIVHDVLPEDRVKIQILALSEEERQFDIEFSPAHEYLFKP